MRFQKHLQRDEIQKAIAEYCKNNKSRQRNDLYDFLNKKLGIKLSVYDYKGTNDHARFACDQEFQKHETDYVIKILSQ